MVWPLLGLVAVRALTVIAPQQAMKLEGIFRLSGSAVLIDKYVARFDKGNPERISMRSSDSPLLLLQGEDVDLSQEKDPHAVAGLLKLWFRDMPEALLTYGQYHNFLGASGLCSDSPMLFELTIPEGTKDQAVQLRFLRHLVNKLPVLNRYRLLVLRKKLNLLFFFSPPLPKGRCSTTCWHSFGVWPNFRK